MQQLLPSKHIDQFTRNAMPKAQDLPLFLFSDAVHYPDQLNCVVELLDRHILGGQGARPCIHGLDIHGQAMTWRYQDLWERVNQIANLLTEQFQLKTGNRVLLRGGNSPMMAACLLAVIKAGCVAVPTMPMLRTAELSHIVNKAEISFALCDASLYDDIKPIAELNVQTFKTQAFDDLCAAQPVHFTARETSRDDVCLIAFTSGTTGKPKATMHFHRDILAMCDLFPKSVLNMQSYAPLRVIGTPPLAFTFGLGGLLAFPLRYGAETILLEKYTAQSFLEAIERYGATQCYTAPTMYRAMMPLVQNFQLQSLTQSISAGEALPTSTRDGWRNLTGLEMIDGIGGTEIIHIYIASTEYKPGAIGRVVEGYSAEIMDAQMSPLPPHQIGRMAVRGPTGCKYLSDERQKYYVQQGWNLPGDNFYKDEEGYFYYVARNDDMIISAGYNIGAPEVEDALLTHQHVRECAVIGVPDEERGQAIYAFVVLKPGANPDDDMKKQLQDHVKTTAAPYKYPRFIRFVDQLPRTETGKLQRFKLRDLL